MEKTLVDIFSEIPLGGWQLIFRNDEMLKGKAATLWRRCRLDAVIGEFLWYEKPDRIYGFFPGKPAWSKGRLYTVISLRKASGWLKCTG